MKIDDDTRAADFQLWLTREHLSLRVYGPGERRADGDRCPYCGHRVDDGAHVVHLTHELSATPFAGRGATFLEALNAAVADYVAWKPRREAPLRADS